MVESAICFNVSSSLAQTSPRQYGTATFRGGKLAFEKELKQYFLQYARDWHSVTGGYITIQLNNKNTIVDINLRPTINNNHSILQTNILAKYFAKNGQWRAGDMQKKYKTTVFIDVFILVGNGGIEYEVTEYQKNLGYRTVFNGNLFISPKQ
jgi:hypothetical protein